ncbi:MAG: peptide chain release factor 2 [Thermoplasmata archaeon]|nr:peptide chain release factor 2 [Thermoplasmata archaeon]
MIAFDLAATRKTVARLEKEGAAPDLWNDPESARALLARLTGERRTIERFAGIEKTLGDLVAIRELAVEANGAELFTELISELGALEERVEDFSLLTYLSGHFDRGDAIMEIKSGAGGVDAADFAGMLLRMYGRWMEKKGYRYTVADTEYFEEAGVRQATVVVEGPYAYGYLSCETGVHRLVRISPFDQTGKRHTSFAQVTVWPKVPEEIEVVIDDKDLRVDTFRAGGPGGQHVNVTDSAVRITHKPTGLVVTCQDEKSQHKNKERALKVLRARLFEIAEREKKEAEAKERKSQVGSGDRSERIRTYNFPQNRITDHRIGLTLYKLDLILDGEIDELVEALVESDAESRMSSIGMNKISNDGA